MSPETGAKHLSARGSTASRMKDWVVVVGKYFTRYSPANGSLGVGTTLPITNKSPRFVLVVKPTVAKSVIPKPTAGDTAIWFFFTADKTQVWTMGGSCTKPCAMPAMTENWCPGEKLQ